MEALWLHRTWMRHALGEAQQALAEGEIPVGAVIVQGETLLASAHNRCEATGDPTAHAEVLALREAGRLTGDWRLRGAVLYVTLEPCIMCTAAMIHARLDAVVFGATDRRRGGAGSFLNLPYDLREDHQLEVIGGIEEASSKALLQTFFSNRRFRRGV